MKRRTLKYQRKIYKMKQLLKYLESCNKLLIQVSYNNMDLKVISLLLR